jgi:O-acetyl-ADP-ribose deacetylase (regulator of RNase III)
MSEKMFSKRFNVGSSAVVELIIGDISCVESDVIVNAANSSLLGGLGVDGAIHSKGGSSILEQCKKLRATLWPDGLPTGYAALTSAGNLRAKYVIHTVGPVWRGGLQGEADLLKQAYWNTLKLAASQGVKSVAFPSISTGAYGYPPEEASYIALKTIKKFFEKETSIEKVHMVLFSEQNFNIYLCAAKQIF